MAEIPFYKIHKWDMHSYDSNKHKIHEWPFDPMNTKVSQEKSLSLFCKSWSWHVCSHYSQELCVTFLYMHK